MSSHFLKTSSFILFLFIAFSCGRKTEDGVSIPAGILSQDEIVIVLRDFALAESAANMNVKGLDMRKMDSVYAFNPLKEHNIRQSQYDSSLSFYVNHPDLYKKIYEDVLVALSEFQTRRTTVVKDTSSK